MNLQGLNLSGSLADGEWAWTQNVDTALCPMIRRREKRMLVGRLDKPNGLFAADKIAFVDGTKFYYNGYYYGDVEDSFKQMAAMGSKICLMPDKVFFDTETCIITPMEQRNTTTDKTAVSLAKADGTPWEEYTTSSTEPVSPADGMCWLDTSGDAPVMKVWSETSGMWVEEGTVCVCVSSPGIGTGLAADDGVTVSGLTQAELNGDWILSHASDDCIVYTGILSEAATQDSPVTVERTCPDMDYIVEHDNRLWGCSSAEHEIYCCALGDPTNWRKYAGLATDSYAVTVGTPGNFTGMAVIGDCVVAMKKSAIHKIYGDYPATYQVYTYNYRGVEDGSAASLVRIGELLYYKSDFDCCVYDGSEVASISGALGVHRFGKAVAGANDRRLYISMQDESGEWQLLTYDTVRRLWMREDGMQALAFASCQTETFMLAADGGVWALREGVYAKDFYMLGSDYKVEAATEPDAEVPWMVRSGEMLSAIPDTKWINRLQVLMDMEEGASAEIALRRDGGTWETVLRVDATEKRRYHLPIRPRRCDRLEIEIRGKGDVKIVNISRAMSAGSEYR